MGNKNGKNQEGKINMGGDKETYVIGVDNSHLILVGIQLRKVGLRHIIEDLKIEQFLFFFYYLLTTLDKNGQFAT